MAIRGGRAEHLPCVVGIEIIVIEEKVQIAQSCNPTFDTAVIRIEAVFALPLAWMHQIFIRRGSAVLVLRFLCFVLRH